MRLNKYIASCGICSRREADKLIEDNRITIGGVVATCGAQVNEGDVVCFDGKEIHPQSDRIVLAYYKPVGVVCTESDVHAKKTVIEDLGYKERVTYAGRLDKDSEGLLIMSNDGDLINSMMRAANKHEKEYEVTVNKPVTGDFINDMSGGVFLRELGVRTRKCKVSKTGKRSFDIILTQGLNRQIRRMCEELGYEVVTLKRVRVMSVKLSDYNLKPGEYAQLSDEAKKQLYSEAGVK
ncbi:23S rRNA pseudouridine2604 synthase [Butyrivibrio hungatei]|uniref:Pseudouridine synthase n=1 Tax=Butyrivibrio hungatei TaxID=185008 RepID=A0A1G5AZ76_9FIRM|nr:pseudouridine synthase [Butyrivibrio hungatei]SCX83121.1 23S rRNA pseudouridine2604 synthase [Butyrivibrio hungatei]